MQYCYIFLLQCWYYAKIQRPFFKCCVNVCVHENHNFSVLLDVDIEITFMKYVQSFMHPQIFFLWSTFTRILNLSKNPLYQLPYAYVYLIRILLLVKKLLFLWLNEHICLKSWWGWTTVTDVSLSFICSAEFYKFLLMQNQGTNFCFFPSPCALQWEEGKLQREGKALVYSPCRAEDTEDHSCVYLLDLDLINVIKQGILCSSRLDFSCC